MCINSFKPNQNFVFYLINFVLHRDDRGDRDGHGASPWKQTKHFIIHMFGNLHNRKIDWCVLEKYVMVTVMPVVMMPNKLKIKT